LIVKFGTGFSVLDPGYRILDPQCHPLPRWDPVGIRSFQDVGDNIFFKSISDCSMYFDSSLNSGMGMTIFEI
jgi:hypothetical protein